MKTSGTFTFLFVALMLFSLISCSTLRMTAQAPACTEVGANRNTCDESKNSFKSKVKPNKCLENNQCAAGRTCKSGTCEKIKQNLDANNTARACTELGANRNTCDESKNSFERINKPHTCERDRHCAAGRTCSKSRYCTY